MQNHHRERERTVSGQRPMEPWPARDGHLIEVICHVNVSSTSNQCQRCALSCRVYVYVCGCQLISNSVKPLQIAKRGTTKCHTSIHSADRHGAFDIWIDMVSSPATCAVAHEGGHFEASSSISGTYRCPGMKTNPFPTPWGCRFVDTIERGGY